MSLAALPTIAEVDAECERRRAALAASPASDRAAALDRFMQAVAEYRARVEAGEAHPGPGVAPR